MTTPPVLSAKQIKKTLSAKKACLKITKSRNVLAWPNELDYWPTLDTQTDEELKTLLASLLAPVKSPSTSIPLEQVKKLDVTKRKEKRLSLSVSGTTALCTTLRRQLLLGLNCVTRAVASGNSSAVLVAGDVAPRALARHVVGLCRRRAVPVVVMPSLQVATRHAAGFGCLALGLRKSGAGPGHSGAEHFGALLERVSALSAAAMQQHRAAAVKSEGKTRTHAVEIPVKQERPSDAVQDRAASVYKLRTSRTQRAFRPGNEGKADLATWLAEEAECETAPTAKAEPAERKPKAESVWRDFIPFGAESRMKAERAELGGAVKSEQASQVKEEAENEPAASVKVGGKLKRKAVIGDQDFIPFGTVPLARKAAERSVEPEAKRKVGADFVSFGGNAVTAMDVETDGAKATDKPVALRPRLPVYRPLVVKSIQPNPNKKKKLKKAKAVN